VNPAKLYTFDISTILWYYPTINYSGLCPFLMCEAFVFTALEEEKMRSKITLACQTCKQRNYNTTKEKKNHPDRMEIKKYCRFCNKHTEHRETK